MQNAHQWMEWSIEQIGSNEIDITPRVYEVFLSRRPEVASYFTVKERDVKGKMLFEVIGGLLDLANDREYVHGMIGTTVNDHKNYGAISREVYADFLLSIVDVVHETLAATGAPVKDIEQCRQAWLVQVERMKALFTSHGA